MVLHTTVFVAAWVQPSAVTAGKGTNVYPEWQQNSTTRCSPPNGIPLTCCLGAVSKGGGTTWPGCEISSTAYTDPLLQSHLAINQGLNLLRAARGRPIVILGDSIAFQMFTALQCDFHTTPGCTVQAVEIIHTRISPGGKKKFGPARPHQMIGVTEAENVSIVCQQHNLSTYIAFYKMYHPWQNHSMLLFPDNPEAIFIFKFDIHWKTGHIDNMNHELLNNLIPYMDTSRASVVVMEQFAQHFAGSGGEYVKGIANRNCTSSSLGNLTSHGLTRFAEERLHTLTSILSTANVSFSVAPIYSYTRLFDFLHPGVGDCTHYCYTPWFWRGIIARLVLAMEEVVMMAEYR